MRDPFVSVILPFRDAVKHLAAAIDSICSQRYGNFEVVLVDDGAEDGSRAIASKYVSRDVTLLCQSNQGVGAAFNAGVRVAQGDYIFLHGADDISHPDRLCRCTDLFLSEKADVVTCRPDIIDGEGALIERAQFPIFEKDCDTRGPYAVLASLFYHENFICAPAAAVSRSLLNRIGPVHAGMIQLQDFDYWLRAASLDARFHFEPTSWLSYRRHDGNLSHWNNLPRSLMERQLVYRRLAPLVTREAARGLLTVGTGVTLDDMRFHDAPASILTPLAYATHIDLSIRQIGYELLLAMMERRDEASFVETRLGLSPSRIFEMIRFDSHELILGVLARQNENDLIGTEVELPSSRMVEMIGAET